MTKGVALLKLQRYCAYQDRCHQEVRKKLLDLGLRGQEVEQVIAELIQDNFLNEQRFACSYARGKFRIKKWGKIKIKMELKRREISPYCIQKGLEEIDHNEYLAELKKLIKTNILRYNASSSFEKKMKTIKYLANKGFEKNLIWQLIDLVDED